MKPLKMIIPFLKQGVYLKLCGIALMIISLTACTGQSQLNIDEFLTKYNSVSGEALEAQMFTVSKDKYYTYSLLSDNVLICLYAGQDGNIIQCTATVKSGTKNSFDSRCVNLIKAFTGFSDTESNEFFKNKGDSGKFHLVMNDYGIGKTMILNEKGNELNTNEYPTLKRQVNEEDIARPTLPPQESTTIIRQ